MDPIAHTLAGATLAQTGLRRLTALATTTLVIGANLPDVDGIMSFFGSDTALYYRRGITHGILAQILLPILLWVAMLLYDRLIRRRRDYAKDPVRPGQLLLLAYVGVLSHPLLDWLNTYGVRLLMPFSGRWFYGDTLFIIDAWLWLLMGATLVLAWSETRLKQVLWGILGLACSALITMAGLVPLAAKILWWLGVGLIVLLRVRGISVRRNQLMALGCLASFILYVALLRLGNHWTENRVKAWISAHHGEELTDIMTGPLPANPFSRDVVAVGARHYYGLRVSLFAADSLELRYPPVPIPKPDPIIERALRNPEIRGFVNWMRYPVYEVQPQDQGFRVIIRDLRYVRPDQEKPEGIGMAETTVLP